MPDSLLDAVSRSPIVSVPLLLCFLAGQIRAETTGWSAVQALPSGQRIKIVLRTGRSVDGAMERVTAEAIHIQRKSGTVTATRPEISRVYRIKPAHRAKWALIGAAVGAGGAVAVGAAALEKEPGLAGAVASVVVLLAAIGAGVGCIIGRPRSALIYTATSP